MNYELFRYTLPLKKTLRMFGHELREREGLILRLCDENGRIGESEIAPLPGLHPETLQQAENQIRSFLAGKSSQNLFASVRFGLETAQRTLTENLKKNAQIPVNGLAVASGKTLRQECEKLRKDGFQTVKLKVGRLTVAEDIERVHSVRNILGDDIALRLDANRAWEWSEALSFARAVNDCKIEYCEEPLKNPKKLARLHEQTGMPLALDEMLWKAPPPEAEAPPANVPMSGIKALVLKPAIIGGWKEIKIWIGYAQKNGAKAIFSSCFESGLGLNRIAFTAINLLPEVVAIGLDTAKWFKHDLIEPPFSPDNGNYLFPDSWPRAKEDFLEKITEERVQNKLCVFSR